MTPLPPMRMRSSGFSLIGNPHYTLYWERKMKLFAWRNAQIRHCPSFSHNFKWRRGTSPCLFTFRYPRETQDEPTPLQDKWDEAELGDTSAIDWKQTDHSGTTQGSSLDFTIAAWESESRGLVKSKVSVSWCSPGLIRASGGTFLFTHRWRPKNS